jgi:hypothetical protein
MTSASHGKRRFRGQMKKSQAKRLNMIVNLHRMASRVRTDGECLCLSRPVTTGYFIKDDEAGYRGFHPKTTEVC